MHQNNNQNQEEQHIPVLIDAVLDCLDPQAGETYLDLTAGYGGHASAILERTNTYGSSVLVDRDSNAIATLQRKFTDQPVKILQNDFLAASQQLASEGQKFDLILADLGVSSPHLNEAHRGFTLKNSGPLDMRMDQRQALTAETIVNTYSETELADILYRYGEEPKARQIARMITEARPIETTAELAEVIKKAWPGHSRTHPATRSFQAIRIAVNDELGMLQKALPIWLEQLLAGGGRIAIISFHSLEDRIVKQQLAHSAGNRYDADLRLLTKRPITASYTETVYNPRARSAKLRAAVKIKTKERELDANSGKK
jgi:16S rRNA (cytosine1402-N4)-methyltransferase